MDQGRAQLSGWHGPPPVISPHVAGAGLEGAYLAPSMISLGIGTPAYFTWMSFNLPLARFVLIQPFTAAISSGWPLRMATPSWYDCRMNLVSKSRDGFFLAMAAMIGGVMATMSAWPVAAAVMEADSSSKRTTLACGARSVTILSCGPPRVTATVLPARSSMLVSLRLLGAPTAAWMAP